MNPDSGDIRKLVVTKSSLQRTLWYLYTQTIKDK